MLLKNGLKIWFLGCVILFAASCSDDDEGDNDDVKVVEVTQADIDNATAEVLIGITGGAMGHAGADGPLADETIRDMYGNVSGQSGTVVTKRVFAKSSSGDREGEPLVTFAMVKREEGYYTEGGDWEYIMMPYSETTDYSMNPNGILVDVGDMRGKLASCSGCHAAAAGGDFLYSNDN